MNRIRWRFQNDLSSIAPDNVVRFEYLSRIRYESGLFMMPDD